MGTAARPPRLPARARSPDIADRLIQPSQRSAGVAQHGGPQNVSALAAGFGIGILWLVFAATCLISAARGFANDRPDWGFGWGLPGVLLLAAGIAAMVGTWWHLTRVLAHGEH